MKRIFIYILFLLFISCQHESGVECTLISMADSYPKGVEKLEYSRELYCILMFKNNTQDSLYVPFYGWGHYVKSAFYLVINKDTIDCSSASFWGIQDNTQIVAPHDSVRIGINLYMKAIKRIGKGKKVELPWLCKEIEIIYIAEEEDKNSQYLTPEINIKKARNIKMIYGAHEVPIDTTCSEKTMPGGNLQECAPGRHFVAKYWGGLQWNKRQLWLFRQRSRAGITDIP